MSIEMGDFAPDFGLNQVDGQPVSLSGLTGAGRTVLLIFLRHLG